MAAQKFSVPSSIKDKLKELGYALSYSMEQYINQWFSWYTGSNSFYKVSYVSASRKKKTRDRFSLRPARKVCREWTSLILNEKTEISSDDESANVWLQEYLKKTKFWANGQKIVEKAFAMGTAAWALWFDINEDAVTDIKIRRYDARMVIPLSWDEDEVTECAFATRVNIKGKTYDQLQLHVLDGESYHIKTYLFYKGKEVSLDNLGIIDDYDTEQNCKTFGIVKPGLDNVVVDLSPYGMSVFYDAVDAIKATDLAFDSIFQEVDLTGIRVFLDESMIDIKDDHGNKIPVADNDDKIYRMVYGADGAKKLIDVFSPNIRIEPLKESLNVALSQLGSNCGFGEQYFQIDKQGGLKTATEVTSDNSDLMRNIEKHENSIGSAIIDIFTGLLSCAIKKGYAEGITKPGIITVTFDDSIITDTQTDKNMMLSEIAAGVVPPWMYLMEFYGKTEEEARQLIESKQLDEGF